MEIQKRKSDLRLRLFSLIPRTTFLDNIAKFLVLRPFAVSIWQMEMLSASSAVALGQRAPAVDPKGETDVHHYVSVQAPRLWSRSPDEGTSGAKLTPKHHDGP